jgi:acetyl esterase/lipase
MNPLLQITAFVLASITTCMSVLFFFQLRWPAPVLWFLKLYTSALSPILVLIGVLTTVVGLTTGSALVTLIGIYNIMIYSLHIYIVTRPPNVANNFAQAFGIHWQNLIRPEQKNHFLTSRTTLKLPAVPNPRFEQNISFATVPNTGRKLLCDIWQPSLTTASSGLAFIYLHGAAWYMLDKDLGTRPFFSHLAAQGHVVMDVAYRLAPETDLLGMVNDVKRAIVWMKENAETYGVNPDSIVVGGGSSGAHLAMLASYTADNPQFTPVELEGRDISVCAVVSLYGPADLEAMYYHLRQHLTTRPAPGRPKPVPVQIPGWVKERMGKEYYRLGFDKDFTSVGTLAHLLGGHPNQCPERYAIFSPITHVHPQCPPTLLIHGLNDVMAPIESTRLLCTRLAKEKIPTVMHILPQTDHAFDLILPGISVSAHNALYDVERFLALMVGKKQIAETRSLSPASLDSHLLIAEN